MMMKACALVLFFGGLLVDGASLRLHRTSHAFQPLAEAEAALPRPHSHYSLLKPSLGNTDVVIPMSGGLLTVGAYFVNMSIGSAGQEQTFNALVDTGSSNIWVTGFKPAQSKSYAPLPCGADECKRCNVDPKVESCLFGPPVCNDELKQCGWGITYGGGGTMATGVLGTDNVCFAKTSLCTHSAPFGLVERNVPSQGALGAIIGLAFPRNACNPSCVTTLFQGMQRDTPGTHPSFSMCLNAENGGVMDFGPVNKSRLDGPIQELKVTHEHWYNLAVTDLVVNGKATGLPNIAFAVTNDVIGSFVDSGTSVLGMGPLPFASLQQTFTSGSLGSLPGMKELWNGQCVPQTEVDPVKGQYPGIEVHIDATGTYTGKGEQIKVFHIPANSYLLKAGKNYCLGIAQISGIGVILGDVFLENYVTVYNPESGTVGLGPLKSGTCVV